MPQLPSFNPSTQRVPRLQIPEAILEGNAEGYPWDGKTIEGQFQKFSYPMAGYSTVQMLYNYGGASIGTMNDSNRYVKAYRTDKLPFVVNQSIWLEGEAKFADILLPACTPRRSFLNGQQTLHVHGTAPDRRAPPTVHDVLEVPFTLTRIRGYDKFGYQAETWTAVPGARNISIGAEIPLLRVCTRLTDSMVRSMPFTATAGGLRTSRRRFLASRYATVSAKQVVPANRRGGA